MFPLLLCFWIETKCQPIFSKGYDLRLPIIPTNTVALFNGKKQYCVVRMHMKHFLSHLFFVLSNPQSVDISEHMNGLTNKAIKSNWLLLSIALLLASSDIARGGYFSQHSQATMLCSGIASPNESLICPWVYTRILLEPCTLISLKSAGLSRRSIVSALYRLFHQVNRIKSGTQSGRTGPIRTIALWPCSGGRFRRWSVSSCVV